MIIKVNPSKILLDLKTDSQITKVKDFLTFTNKAAEQALQRFKKARWYLNAHGEEAFYAEIDRLKGEIKQCLLLEESDGLYTYSGMAEPLAKLLNCSIVDEVEYPEEKLLPWDNEPKNKQRYYQEEAVERLLKVKHGGVEISTGLGKTDCILHIVKRLGLQALIVSPSTSIAEQIYQSFVYHFGSKRVGKCFGGKKEYKKMITIALPQTLIKLDEKSDVYKKLSECKVVLFDESHTCPAKTLSDVCFGLAKDVPYRFFFSATQMRNDGKDLLLDAITGPIVYNMSLSEGVDQGFLSKPNFKMIRTSCDVPNNSDDPNELTRHYLYYNQKVVKQAATLANYFVKHLDHTVLILIDEVEQFTKLLPYFEYEARFAHGPLGENKKKVPEKYWEADNTELVQKFNDKEFQILVGTSAVSTGTDFRTVNTIIYLVGGKSEIAVKQAIGRGTRKANGKDSFNFIDFDVVNCQTTHRHSVARADIYQELYPGLEYMDF